MTLLSCREYVRDPYLIVEFNYESKKGKKKGKRKNCVVWCVVCWHALLGWWMSGAHRKQEFVKEYDGEP